MSRQPSVDALLRGILGGSVGRRRRLPPVPVMAAASPDASACTSHLFERRRGASRCKWCGALAPHARLRSGSVAGGPRVRMCPPESEVQAAVIKLFVSIGCRYHAKLDTDIYVLGTRRPRNLPRAAHRTYQTPGIADLLIFLPIVRRYERPTLPPPFLWFECKAEDGVMSEAQEQFEELCHRRGIAHVKGGVDEGIAFLVQHGYLREV